jgi:galactose mutarotase-like enzyme
MEHNEKYAVDGHWVGGGTSNAPNIPGRSYALMTLIDHPYFFIEVGEDDDCTLQKIDAGTWQEAERKMDELVSHKRSKEPKMIAFDFEKYEEAEAFLESISSS